MNPLHHCLVGDVHLDRFGTACLSRDIQTTDGGNHHHVGDVRSDRLGVALTSGGDHAEGRESRFVVLAASSLGSCAGPLQTG